MRNLTELLIFSTTVLVWASGLFLMDIHLVPPGTRFALPLTLFYGSLWTALSVGCMHLVWCAFDDA